MVPKSGEGEGKGDREVEARERGWSYVCELPSKISMDLNYFTFVVVVPGCMQVDERFFWNKDMVQELLNEEVFVSSLSC